MYTHLIAAVMSPNSIPSYHKFQAKFLSKCTKVSVLLVFIIIITVLCIPTSRFWFIGYTIYQCPKVQTPIEDYALPSAQNTRSDESYLGATITWTNASFTDRLPIATYGAMTYGVNELRYALFADEQNANADRVVNQMRYVPPDVHPASAITPSSTSSNTTFTNTKKSILLDFGTETNSEWKNFESFNCPVAQCEFTENVSIAPSADAIVWMWSNRLLNHQRPSNQIWVLFQLESPYLSPSYTMFSSSINFSATYRRDSTIPVPYGKFLKFANNSQQPQRFNYAAGKTKKVAWFVSNCRARNKRLEYARQLARYIDVDIYGKCGDKKCPVWTKPCYELLAKDYKFYLAFENANCRDYITEKLFENALRHNVLPIVMGAHPDDYRRDAPEHSYIHVDDFAGPAELAAYLRKLDCDDRLYNKYFEWKGTGEFVNTNWWCRLCTMLHVVESERRMVQVANIDDWWSKDVCIDGSWRGRHP